MTDIYQLKKILCDISKRYIIDKDELFKLYIKKEKPVKKNIIIKDDNVFTRMIADNRKYEIVFTDGSCQRKMASMSVFFGIGDKRNIGEVLDIQRPTNQKAELYAILKALEIMEPTKNYLIYTDSQYSIDCLTKWYRSWIKNEWKTSKNKEVLNQEIIKPILNLMNYRTVQFKHVRAHKKAPPKDSPKYIPWFGNMMSDKLAQNAIINFNENKVSPPTGENKK